MMIDSITINSRGGDAIDVSGFTAAEMRVPLVELRAGVLDRPLSLTPEQAIALAAALITAATRARQKAASA